MRELRFVTVGDDGAHVVVETSDGGEQFQLPLDSDLRAATRTDRSAGTTSGTAPTITPREIQTRVRAGESPAELAEANGTTLEWLLRFAQPVLDERARIADEARRGRARRSTTEGQLVIFGEAVDARFTKHGIEPGDVRWDSRRREDGQWIVSAHWIGGSAEWAAEWLFHLAARNLTPLDDTAADLLSDRPIRPVAPPTPPTRPGLSIVAPVEVAEVADYPAGDDEVFDQEALDDVGLIHPRHAFAPAPPADFQPPPPLPPAGAIPAEYGGVADEPASEVPEPGYGVDPGYAVDPGFTADPGYVAETGGTDPHNTDSVGRDEHLLYESGVRYELQVGQAPPISYDAPALPLRLADGELADSGTDPASKHTNPLPRITNLGVAGREESDEEKAARARIPSWDDILMGVRRKHD